VHLPLNTESKSSDRRAFHPERSKTVMLTVGATPFLARVIPGGQPEACEGEVGPWLLAIVDLITPEPPTYQSNELLQVART
jgi:hypothetical protein